MHVSTMNIPQDKYVEVNGIKTRYWTAGDSGPVILLVHGFAASVEYWMYNFSELAKKHRVYALDMAGFGRSDKPKADYSAKYLADFIYQFIYKFDLEELNLVGHSLGGAVCLQLTLDHPELIKKLVLVDSAGFGQQLPHGLRLLTVPFLGKLLLRFDHKALYARALLAYSYNRAAFGKEFIDRMYDIFISCGTKKMMLLLLRKHANYFGIRWRSIKSILHNLDKIKAPTFIMWGRQDRLLPLKHGKDAVKRIDDAKLYIFDDCGHVPQIEQRDKFNQLLLSFITDA